MIDILIAIQAAAVIQAPSPVITDIRADAFLEVAPPNQAITMSPRPASDGAIGAVNAAVQFAEEVAGVARFAPSRLPAPPSGHPLAAANARQCIGAVMAVLPLSRRSSLDDQPAALALERRELQPRA